MCQALHIIEKRKETGRKEKEHKRYQTMYKVVIGSQ